MADFVYPYNFVSRDNLPKSFLPFKPLHRFDGLTGRIKYKLKNLTPLFIPDPEGTTVYKIGNKESDIHKVMDFFNVKGRLCIPPTSIKGMVRSVFEAATNSTFGVIDLDDVRYSYRKFKGFRNRVGVYQNGQIIPYKIKKLSLNVLKKAIAKIENIAENQITEDTIKKYHDKSLSLNDYPSKVRILLQRFYLDDDVKNSKIKKSKKYVYAIFNPEKPINVPDEVIRNYRDVNEKIEKPNPLNKLRDGMVVYYRVDEDQKVTEFGPVAVFKSAENASLKEIIEKHSKHLLPPTTADKLCPATRLFGWTPQSDEANEQGVAGRVRFSPAWGNKTLKDTVLVPLKILGSPRPKYYPFYLKPVNPKITDKSAYYTLDSAPPFSATPGKIRGQKFYLHHPEACKKGTATIDYIKKETDPDNPAHTNQNSTCAVLPAGDAEFEGYIEFESLDAYELGGLLWCLTLSDDPKKASPTYAHKLGKGKGIGMGTVQFEITDIELFNPQDNWFSLDKSKDIHLHENITIPNDGVEYVKAFKEWLSDEKKFEELPNIKDLLLILEIDLVKNKPIMYRSPKDKHDEGFKYFAKQREKRVVNAKNKEFNREEPLLKPSELKEGRAQKG